MRTQCKRIYSAMPLHCDRICNGRCDEACVSDASPESRVQSPESRTRVRAVGVQRSEPKTAYSPSPNRSLPSAYTQTPTTLRQVWQTLLSGLHSISENDYGRPWPYPDRRRLAVLVAQHDDDLCLKAAVETKSIVQSQDRAPKITALFEKKLHDLAEVRATVRESLGGGEG